MRRLSWFQGNALASATARRARLRVSHAALELIQRFRKCDRKGPRDGVWWPGMMNFDVGRRRLVAGAALTALGGCMRLDHGAPLRRIVLRLPANSRPVFWEKAQKFAAQNHLASDLVPQRPATARDFAFLLRGRGLNIIGRNNAYDPLQPDDYVVGFYSNRLFGADRATIDRYADAFRNAMLSENSVRLISDNGPAK